MYEITCLMDKSLTLGKNSILTRAGYWVKSNSDFSGW